MRIGYTREIVNPEPHLGEQAQSRDEQALLSVASSPGLTEEIALALLTRRDLTGKVIETIAKNSSVHKHRKVTIAIVSHPKAPRHVSLPIARHLYTFELVKIALLPAVPADVKAGVDETILSRLSQITEGERLTLARQASGRIAGALLHDAQERVVQAALHNPKMTEAILIKAMSHKDVLEHLVRLVCVHPQWVLRRDVRLALLRSAHIDLAHAIAFMEGFPASLMREVLANSGMREDIRKYLLVALGENS